MLIDIDIEAMVFSDPIEAFIGASGDQGQPAELVTLEPQTGLVISTIPLTLDGAPVTDEVVGLTIHPVSETLYGWAEREGLFIIDPVSGAMSLVLEESWDAQDITWDLSGGLLYLVGGTELRSWIPGDTELTLIGNGLPEDAEALDVLADGTLVISAEPNGVTQLVQVDPAIPAIIATIDPDPTAFYDDLEAVVVMGDCNPFSPSTPTPLVTGTPVPTETPTPTSTPTPSPTETPTPTPTYFVPSKFYALNALGGRDVQFLEIDTGNTTVSTVGPVHNNHDLESLLYCEQNHELLSIRRISSSEYTLARYGASSGGFVAQTTLTEQAGDLWGDEIEGLTGYPEIGVIWGWSKGRGLVEIDVVTGVVEVLFSSTKDINAAAYRPWDGRFFLTEDERLWYLNASANSLERALYDLPGPTEGLCTIFAGELMGVAQTSGGFEIIQIADDGSTLWSIPFSGSGFDIEGLDIGVIGPMSPTPTPTPTAPPPPAPDASQEQRAHGRFVAVPGAAILELQLPGFTNHSQRPLILGEVLLRWLIEHHDLPVSSMVVRGDIPVPEHSGVDLLIWEEFPVSNATLSNVLSNGTSILAIMPLGPDAALLVADDSGSVFSVPFSAFGLFDARPQEGDRISDESKLQPMGGK